MSDKSAPWRKVLEVISIVLLTALVSYYLTTFYTSSSNGSSALIERQVMHHRDLVRSIERMRVDHTELPPYVLNDEFLAEYFRAVPLVGMIDLDSLYGDSIPVAGALADHVINLGDTLKYRHRTIQLRGTTYFIVEGDMLFTKRQYMRYLTWLARRPDIDSTMVGKLVGERLNGAYVRQPPGQILKYAVVRGSFDTDAEYQLVARSMAAATREWEGACDVRFEHIASMDELDLVAPNESLTFIVSGFDSNDKFIALAFFPYDPPSERVLLVDKTYFSTSYDKVGVFRHEIGHILGWRHEAARPEAPMVCQGELLTGTLNLTQYDPNSVMHYFCGGVGSLQLQLSDSDRVGAQRVYGPPRVQ